MTELNQQEQLINDMLKIAWRVSRNDNSSTLWSKMRDEISGMQTALIWADLEQHEPVVDDLGWLWTIAFERELMAKDDEVQALREERAREALILESA